MALVNFRIPKVQAESAYVSHWDFNEESGDIVHDSIGGYNGTKSLNASWISSAIELNGDNSFVSTDTQIPITSNFTFTIKLGRRVGTDYGEGETRKIVRVNEFSLLLERNTYNIHFSGLGYGYPTGFTNTSINDSVVNLTVVLDDYILKFYNNGYLVNSFPVLTPIPSVHTSSSVVFGASDQSSASIIISDAKLYNVALSNEEVLDDYQHNGLSCTEDTWSCDAWSSCSFQGNQTRNCNKSYDCKIFDTLSPITTQTCSYIAPSCTSWIYSDWSACSVDELQTRSITSSSPSNCEDGSPVLEQSCTYIPSCTTDIWTSGDWNSCAVNGTQTRTNIKTFDCEFVDTTEPSSSQSCSYSAPACSSWVYSAWDTCSASGQQTRTISTSSPDDCAGGSPILTQSCSYSAPTCFSWTYSDWSACSTSGQKTRTISTSSPSGCAGGSPVSTQSCSYIEPYLSPVISSINPKAITPGDTISINGSNFGSSQGSSKLIIEGSSYPSGTISLWSDTKIEYKTSAYSDDYSKKVEIKKCKSYSDCLSIVSGGYFYIQPKIISLDYTSGPAGANITITGKYLKNSNVASDDSETYNINVYFNGSLASYPIGSDWTESSIEVLVPDNAKSGNVSLEIISNTGEKVSAIGPRFDVWEKLSNDEYSSFQLYLKQINLPQAWGFASNRRMITVAVIDDGVYNNHPDLKNKMWENTDEIIGNSIDDDKNGYIDDYYGWDFIYNTSDVTPLGSHGTQVAGIIGAEKDNGIGIAGVNSNIKIMPLIVCDDSGCMDYSKAIRYAVDNGAEVINLSLGTDAVSGYTTSVNDAIEYAYQHNVLIVTAAGNGDTVGGIGFDLTQIPQSPVCNNDQKGNRVIGVGAVDENNHRTSWSNYGSCVDIWAPGVDIVSTAVPAYNTSGDLYDLGDGTSFSAPIITGIVSLLKASYPTITSQEAIDLLMQNSNNGIVDAYKTLNANFISTNIQIEKPKTNLVAKEEDNVYNSSQVDVSDGDIIQCQNCKNPSAVYIVKQVGETKYIRHIVSLEIFNFYTHLKWENLKQVANLGNFSMSGWVRVDTDPNERVYEINGDQTRHWINMTAQQFLSHGGSDVAIYNINQGELDLYTAGADVMMLN